MRNTLFAFALLLTACTTPADVRQEHLLACAAYTSVLESIAVRKEAGLFSSAQLSEIQAIEARTTPLCQSPTPSAEGAALVNQALLSLEAYLLTQAAE